MNLAGWVEKWGRAAPDRTAIAIGRDTHSTYRQWAARSRAMAGNLAAACPQQGRVAIAMTNTRGLYLFKSLPVGAYTLTAYVDGFALSRANIQTRGAAYAKVDFDLRLDAGDGADRIHTYIRALQVVNGNPH